MMDISQKKRRWYNKAVIFSFPFLFFLVFGMMNTVSAQHHYTGGYMKKHHMHHKKKAFSLHKIKMFYMKALEMAPEEKKKEIEDNLIRLIEEAGKKKAELKASKMKLFLSLRNPRSTDKEIQENFKAFMSKKNEYMNVLFSYVMKLRRIIGAEMFAEIFKKTHKKMMGHKMMMKGSGSKH